MSFKSFAVAALAAVTVLLTGCATGPQKWAVDEPDMRSILIVPVVNDTTNVEAEALMYATATYPLAEGGYYVFPAETVKMVLEQEGLYEPEQVQKVEPAKLASMFHSDAVMFIKVTYWDAAFAVFNTRTQVTAEYTLFRRDGTQIWNGTSSVYMDSNGGSSNSLLGLIIDSAVAAVNRAAPNFQPVAKATHMRAIGGWRAGPYKRAANGEKN